LGLGSQYGNPITVRGQQILPGAHYGILFLIIGTALSTAIALAIAVPLGCGAAMFLAEAVPALARSWVSFLVELLAAILASFTALGDTSS
jgi:phosphate transport system permease protein